MIGNVKYFILCPTNPNSDNFNSPARARAAYEMRNAQRAALMIFYRSVSDRSGTTHPEGLCERIARSGAEYSVERGPDLRGLVAGDRGTPSGLAIAGLED